MNFEFSDEQRMLKEMLTDFARSRYGFEARQAALASADGFSRPVWSELAGLGVLGIPFAEADGGLGGGGVETMIVMETVGEALMLEPFLATVMLAAGVLREAGTAEQCAEHFPAMIAGERLIALAHYERGGPRHRLDNLRTRALRNGKGWRIDGAKTAVLAGAAADAIIVSAATDAGVSLFLVDAGNLDLERSAGYDGSPLAEVRLEGVEVDDARRIGEPGAGATILGRVFEEAAAAVCAEAVGVMGDMLDTSVEYLKTRTQFGVSIGSFQALQHRAVDMLMEVEMARSMAVLAALSLGRPLRERSLNISAAKAKIGRAGRFVGQQAVQLHGAIGLTEEYKVGHGFKRLTAIDALFGDADHHAELVAEARGLPPIS